jgi:hypothetical protein
MAETNYVLGTHNDEIARLGLQHRVWRDAVTAVAAGGDHGRVAGARCRRGAGLCGDSLQSNSGRLISSWMSASDIINEIQRLSPATSRK